MASEVVEWISHSKSQRAAWLGKMSNMVFCEEKLCLNRQIADKQNDNNEGRRRSFSLAMASNYLPNVIGNF